MGFSTVLLGVIMEKMQMNNDKKTTHQLLDDLEGMVWHIKPIATWKHLGYSVRTLTKLKNICRDFIPGKGITCIFSGESGTSQTLAAEVIAKELNLNLYRIGLSAVVSKYIGETEKNLGRIFDAAKDSGCILLFDEADAMFGIRAQVSDTHDRATNIETGYLLQRMEEYTDIAILATNRLQNLDKSFVRRMRFVVKFPFSANKRRKKSGILMERVQKGRAHHLR